MKKIIVFTVSGVVALALTACGASAGITQSNSAGANSGSANSSNPAPGNGTPSAGPSGLQLAAGMLKLEGTSNAVTPQEAAKLLPLWQSLQQTESAASSQTSQGGTTATPGATPGARFDPAVMQQVAAEVTSIENAMPPAQVQAIAAMNLSRQDIFTAFQQAGIQMGGFGQGGSGFRTNGGTFTPPQGTPPANRTPGAFQGNGGGRAGFASFIPPSVVDGIVQFLQKTAGS